MLPLLISVVKLLRFSRRNELLPHQAVPPLSFWRVRGGLTAQPAFRQLRPLSMEQTRGQVVRPICLSDGSCITEARQLTTFARMTLAATTRFAPATLELHKQVLCGSKGNKS